MVVIIMKKSETGKGIGVGGGQCRKVYDGGQERAPKKDDI